MTEKQHMYYILLLSICDHKPGVIGILSALVITAASFFFAKNAANRGIWVFPGFPMTANKMYNQYLICHNNRKVNQKKKFHCKCLLIIINFSYTWTLFGIYLIINSRFSYKYPLLSIFYDNISAHLYFTILTIYFGYLSGHDTPSQHEIFGWDSLWRELWYE